MKKILLLMCLTTLFYTTQAQTTYYWVGGTATSSIRTNANWNTALNGSGTVRTVNATDDILIFDGTNIGGTTPTTGTITATVSSDSSSKFIFQNNANVVFTRPPAGGGSGTLSLIGGTGDDLVIGAGSTLTIGGNAADGNVVLNLFAGATGNIEGNLNITGSGVHRLTSQTKYGLIFKSTAVCTLSTTPASSGYPFGSATQGTNAGMMFQSGATLITSGTYSPMGGGSTHQAAILMPGSNYYIKSTNIAALPSTTGSWTSNKYFGNVYIQNGASFLCDGSILYMDNLTIDAGCSFTTHTSGSTPVTGNLVVNGTLTSPAASTNTLVFGGNGAQTLTGTGTLNIASLAVGDNSDLTISNNVNVANSAQITGKINFGTNVISGTGTFSSRTNPTALAMTGNVNADSLRVNNTSINGVPTAPSGLVGLTVTGAGIQPNTTVIATSGGNFYLVLSKPATITGTAVPLTFTGGTSTLTTANPNGFDSTNGCVTVAGKKTFQTGTNYVINAATTKPIGISSGQDSAMAVGNLTLNAAATTNINTKVNGVLTLNSGKLSVRATDTVRISLGASIAGAPFSTSKYIALNGAAASLRIDSFSTTKLFPIGDANNYMPVTLIPSESSSFIVNTFQGATVDGTATGNALTTIQKANVVDAIWNINRIAGANGCDVTLSWPASLEGSNFAAYTNSQIGVGHYEAGVWGLNIGSGDNTANTATANFSTFSPFGVGKLGDNLLPVKLYNLKATLNSNAVNISWSVSNEIDMNKYVVERSNDGRNFEKVGEVLALNKNENNYQFTNNNVAAGTYYYRVASIEKGGKTIYSQILKVSSQTKLTVSAYPNPASKQIVVAGVANGATLQITNAIGKVVYKNVATAQTQVIETSNLLSGVYFINITNVDGTTNTVSFIKK